MKISVQVDGRVLTATLADNPTARDFASLLPLTVTMDDLFGREKFARLPRGILEGGERTKTYAVGDVIYWPPGPDVAVYYRHDGETIPQGVIPIAKLDDGAEALNVPGSVEITFAPLN